MANVMMSGVYNHFLTSYASADTTKADSHKKNELKDIYKSIVRINKDSPLYLLKQDNKTQENAIALKEAARKMQGDLSLLKGDDDSLFTGKTASSSDEKAVSATFIGDSNGSSPSFDIEVKELATPQVNTGSFVPPGKSGLDPGSYFFDARIDSQNYEFQFLISNNDTNLDIQNRIVSLVNKAGVGLSASLITNENGENAIEIESENTGRSSPNVKAFDIMDALNSPKHGIVPYFGLGNTTSDATNAKFSINGDEHTSIRNRFTVANTYELELKDTSENPITITTKSDNEAIIDNIGKMVDSYNSFIDKISNFDDGKFSKHMITSSISAILGNRKDSLESIGIKLGDDSKISFDKDILTTSPDDIGEKMTPAKDFANSLDEFSKNIMLDPMKYTDSPVVNYKNPGKEHINPYVTSEYTGMMFNNYC